MDPNNQHTNCGTEGVRQRLEALGVRPTRQRVLIADIMLRKPQHLSAEQVLAEARMTGHKVSKATVYNTLSLFAQCGLVREVIVDPQRVFYDSNTSDHHHLYNEDDGSLNDIELGRVRFDDPPDLPAGAEVLGIDVIVRIRRTSPDS